MTGSVLWLRRDLRRADHPALVAAASEGPVLPLVVIDATLWEGAGVVRRAWYAASVRACAEAYDGQLVLRVGDPRKVVPAVAREVGAQAVHVTRESTPFGRRRDAQVERELSHRDIRFISTGTPYAVGPGLVVKQDGAPYQVFTPFRAAWRDHGWPAPAGAPANLAVAHLESDREAWSFVDDALSVEGLPPLPEPGEAAALRKWREFLDGELAAYDTDRDRPDRPGTSQLSPHLKVGAIHPRTLLADLAGRRDRAADTFVSELAWREFYADVLWHNPSSAWRDLKPTLSGLAYDEADDLVEAWRQGRTGYPIVDAGMRQLLATGWMHNRVRMITASFLTKDLHVWWPIGARHFLDHLVDGDLASNSHGWQWVAGTGTDASPYFRVFNPVTQGKKFDPDGAYVRRWVPELAHLAGAAAHEPWTRHDGYAAGYCPRIVDHAQERVDALARLAAAKERVTR